MRAIHRNMFEAPRLQEVPDGVSHNASCFTGKLSGEKASLHMCHLEGIVMTGWVAGNLKPLMIADPTFNRWICKGAKVRERGISQFTVDCFA